MTVLELSAIDLNERSRIACSALCGSFYQAGLAGAGRSDEQKASHRPARNAHPQRECLVNAHNLPYRIVLADDPASQAGFELLSLESCLCGIQKVWIGQLRLLHFHLSRSSVRYGTEHVWTSPTAESSISRIFSTRQSKTFFGS